MSPAQSTKKVHERALDGFGICLIGRESGTPFLTIAKHSTAKPKQKCYIYLALALMVLVIPVIVQQQLERIIKKKTMKKREKDYSSWN